MTNSTDQLGLFEPKARRKDPPSSHIAARKVAEKSIKQRELVMALVRKHPGMSSKELAAVAAHGEVEFHRLRYTFARRLSELRDQKQVFNGTPVEGSSELTWWPK